VKCIQKTYREVTYSVVRFAPTAKSEGVEDFWKRIGEDKDL
jgi:hypothetical protein